MTLGSPRFRIMLGVALILVGTGAGVLYFQGPFWLSAKRPPADTSLISDDQKIAMAERQIFAIVPQKQAVYEKAFADLSSAGVVHSTSLPSRDAIHRREELVKRFDDANTALEEIFRTAEETLRQELLRQGFSEYTSAKVAARFAEGANIPLLLKIRAYDRASNTVFLQLLDLLDARWGTWKPSAEDHLLFNNTGDANAYNALRQQIVEIGAAQQAAQAEVRQRIQDAGKPKF